MPSKIAAPATQIPLSPLTQSSFSPFGHVIANPSKHPGKTALYTPQSANQDSATKYPNVSDLTNHYTLATSKRPAKPVINLFTCRPRKLRITGGQYTQVTAYPNAGQQVFYDIPVLERHPYTSQTFIPLGQADGETDASIRYLVIVAPTLPLPKDRADADRQPPYPQRDPAPRRNVLSVFSRARPAPYPVDGLPRTGSADRRYGGPNDPRGVGAPDLKNARAFIATGDQAVTYGPGVWHAPMVVLGKGSIDFVVVQYANGVAAEDVQEVYLQGDGPNGEGLAVTISGVGDEILGSGVEDVKPKL